MLGPLGPAENRLGAGLGITLEEADQMALCVQPAEALAYADVVLREILNWLATLTDDDLEYIPHARKHLAPYPEYQTAGHHAETDDLLDLPIWRLLSGPCIGHVRGHLGDGPGSAFKAWKADLFRRLAVVI